MGTSIYEADLSKGALIESKFCGDQFELSLLGEIGRAYQIQAAYTLDSPDWADIGTLTNLHLITPFVDTNTGGAGQCFYRTLPVP
jgi:hypothetical protein